MRPPRRLARARRSLGRAAESGKPWRRRVALIFLFSFSFLVIVLLVVVVGLVARFEGGGARRSAAAHPFRRCSSQVG